MLLATPDSGKYSGALDIADDVGPERFEPLRHRDVPSSQART